MFSSNYLVHEADDDDPFHSWDARTYKGEQFNFTKKAVSFCWSFICSKVTQLLPPILYVCTQSLFWYKYLSPLLVNWIISVDIQIPVHSFLDDPNTERLIIWIFVFVVFKIPCEHIILYESIKTLPPSTHPHGERICFFITPLLSNIISISVHTYIHTIV